MATPEWPHRVPPSTGSVERETLLYCIARRGFIGPGKDLEQRMRIGVSLPVREMAGDLGAIRDFAQGAEALGLTHLRVPDLVIRPGSGQPPPEPARSDAS